MATLRTDLGIESKRCAFIHSQNTRLYLLPQALFAPVALNATALPMASAAPMVFHASKLSAFVMVRHASRPILMMRRSASCSAWYPLSTGGSFNDGSVIGGA